MLRLGTILWLRSTNVWSIRPLTSQLPFKNVTNPFSNKRNNFVPPSIEQKSIFDSLEEANKTAIESSRSENTTQSIATTEASKDLKPAFKEPIAKPENMSNDANDDPESDQWHQDREKRRQKLERNTRLGGLFLIASAVVGSVSFALYYGRAERDKHGNIIEDEYNGQLLAPFYRIYNNIEKWRSYMFEPSRNSLLPDPLQPPYHQPKYTLVIEIKNVLVNPQWTYKTGYRFLKRPGLDYFLNVIGYPNFEVVIYTCETVTTFMPVIDSLDPNNRIMFRLFRDCNKFSGNHYKKDLSKLNRDLSKVIYIDFDATSGSLNTENLLLIPEWKGNLDDSSLVDLAELLKTIHLSDVDDVRPTLQYYSQFADPTSEFKKRAAYLSQQVEQQGRKPEEMSVTSKFTGRLFGHRRHQVV